MKENGSLEKGLGFREMRNPEKEIARLPDFSSELRELLITDLK